MASHGPAPSFSTIEEGNGLAHPSGTPLRPQIRSSEAVAGMASHRPAPPFSTIEEGNGLAHPSGTPLRPQIRSSEAVAGMASHRPAPPFSTVEEGNGLAHPSSTPLRPQIRPSEAVAGMASHRSAPPFSTIEEGNGLAHPSGTPLRPQIHPSEAVARMASHRPAPPFSTIEEGNVLAHPSGTPLRPQILPSEAVAGMASHHHRAQLLTQIHAVEKGDGLAHPHGMCVRPQIQAGEEVGAVGMASHRYSTHLLSEIHPIEEGNGLAHPCGTPLHPQIHPSEEVAGMASHRRSTRLLSQIHTIKECDELAHPCGMCVHPQIHVGEEDIGTTRRRRRRQRGTSPEAPSSLPDNDDILREIFLRLPSDLYSFPRVTAICKRWRGLLIDPKFLCQFYAHHRKPPLLGIFENCSKEGMVFTPIPALVADYIPLERFSLGRPRLTYVLDCRHGRVLIEDLEQKYLIVCDPITSEKCRVALPCKFKWSFVGAVLCTAGYKGPSSPFKVVLVSWDGVDNQLLAYVYSSMTDTWGNLISVEAPDNTYFHGCRSTLVGNVLYWPVMNGRGTILEFDWDSQNLTMIKGPPGMNNTGNFQIIQAEDGAVGLTMLSCHNLQMWQRKVNCQGVCMWLLQKTVSLHKLLKIPPRGNKRIKWQDKFLGYEEDNDVIFLYRYDSVYMVQLKSMQSRKFNGTRSREYRECCYPFTGFFPPGTTISSGCKDAEMLG
ncbi:hypothetical protein ACQJBY_036961 [Aegilops geniculata]